MTTLQAAGDDPAATEIVNTGDLRPGDQFLFEPVERVLTVVSVQPTGTVKFGQVGPEAVPIVRVTVEGMPKPFKGWFECAGDSPQTVTKRSHA